MEDSKRWVRECLRQGHQKYRRNVVLVLDNAPAHSIIEDIINEDEFSDDYILRLAPYSPMHNPIENIWSVLKSHVKK